MEFMDGKRRDYLGSQEFAVKVESARLHAQFQLYSTVTARARGVKGWERGRLGARPTVIYDLSGLPLYYDFALRRGNIYAGFIRTAANKVLGDPVVSVQVTRPRWNLRAARNGLEKLVQEKYPEHRIRRVRLVCYSYPKLGLSAELVSPRKASETIVVDVADLSVVPLESEVAEEAIGQVAYSIMGKMPEQWEKEGPEAWTKVNRAVDELFQQEPRLAPDKVYALPPRERLAVIERVFEERMPMRLFTEKVLDFCCHTGDCRDHECFCLHPQENGVHCARASAQMMLCYWRYCYSQHQIAEAYGVEDHQLTPAHTIAPGLESLTHGCFDATRYAIQEWARCKSEINARRPFMSCVPRHARACAGYEEWYLWIADLPQPRYLYIFNPWPPNVGAVSWENFNTTVYSTSYGMYTLERKVTDHA
jgi:hypothetical protein